MALLPEDKKLRRLEAAMIVGALYAAWEKYIESAMAEVVDLILRVSPFTSLDVGFQERYRRGFSHVLGKNETRRFSHLSTRFLIESYHALLNNAPAGLLVPEVVVFHNGNLRLEELIQLLSQIDIGNVEKWLSDDS
jgi:hypothetical protein